MLCFTAHPPAVIVRPSRFPIAQCARSRFLFSFWQTSKNKTDPRRRHDTTRQKKKTWTITTNDPRQNKYQPTKTTTTPKSIPRGFRKTWSIEQLTKIADLGQNQPQQQEGRQRQHENTDGTTDTPPEGAVEDPNTQTGNEYPASPVFLSEEAVATLGTPCGGDIDPVMTAVFKVTPPLPIVVPDFFYWCFRTKQGASLLDVCSSYYQQCRSIGAGSRVGRTEH